MAKLILFLTSAKLEKGSVRYFTYFLYFYLNFMLKSGCLKIINCFDCIENVYNSNGNGAVTKFFFKEFSSLSLIN